MNLPAYLGRRLLFTLPLVIGITLATFLISHVVPADPLGMVLSERAMQNPEIVKAYRERFGLDKPLPEQYAIYLQNLLQGDFGTSIATQRPVSRDLAQFLPATLELSLGAMLVAVLLGLPIGVLAAVRRDRLADHCARIISLIGVSVPVFWLGLLALNLFYFHLNWLPGPGRLDPHLTAPATVTGLLTLDSLLARDLAAFWSSLRHLILPSLVLGSYSMGTISRITRSTLLEALGQDYVRTARAKGLEERAVVLTHALRNALIPTVTVTGLAFGNLMAGAVLTETIFSWPGIGRYAVGAAAFLDFPAIMGVTLLIGFLYVAVNLGVDVAYAFLDPRIRIGRKA